MRHPKRRKRSPRPPWRPRPTKFPARRADKLLVLTSSQLHRILLCWINAFPDCSDNQFARLRRLRSRQHDDTVAGRAAAGHWFITEEVQATRRSPRESISRVMTPLMQPVTHRAELQPPRPALRRHIHRGFAGTLHPIVGNSNSGQLPSITLTNGRERRRTYCLGRNSLALVRV